MEVSDTVYHYDAKTMKLKSQLVVVPLKTGTKKMTPLFLNIPPDSSL